VEQFISDFEFVRRLLTAALLGGLLGLERETRSKPAGLRTNILISIGSAIFTMMSIELGGTGGTGADESRVASQIVVGVGFLGAGAIMRHGTDIAGLTTAAAIWVNAAIGVTAGTGHYQQAFIATIVTLVVLLALQPVEWFIARASRRKDDSGTDSDQVSA
jgi:putative Mg2+ transporter-C (MgtC) family protein